MFKMTKIGATIGPSCDEVEKLLEMIKGGLNFARLNFSHGDYDSHKKLINNLREAEKETGEPIAIMQDLQGPKIRTGSMPEEGVEIKSGDKIELTAEIKEYQGNEIPLDFDDLYQYLKSGERILVDDGRIELKVEKIKDRLIVCEVIEGGFVKSHKGLNLPDSKLDITVLSEKDKSDLRFGVEAGIDMLAMSFVKGAKDILDVRFLIEQYEKELNIKDEEPIRIIAKIERHEAVDNIKEIIEVADGIMVARGDLGLEMPASQVPLVQKRIIDMCNEAAKPVIVATQLLDSMREARRPTRAEVSDVANAVIDHTDGLLLTNETATGKHPVLVVKTMAEIITATETSSYDDTELPKIRKKGTPIDTVISELTKILSEEVDAKLILAASLSGETGRLISHVRPRLPILVATGSDRVWRQLNLSWGVSPFRLEPCRTIEELIQRSILHIKKTKFGKERDCMIVVAGEPVGQAGNVNLVEVREIN